MPQFNLTVLVRELLSERDLRGEFNRNPERVMREYGLTDAERHMLYKMDPTIIGPDLFPPVDNQVVGFNIPQGEFRPAGPNCIPDPGVVLPTYPIPKPALFRVRPRRLTANDIITVVSNNVTTKYIEIVVYGQSYSRNPEPEITIRHQGTGAALQVNSTNLFGTMRCSELSVRIIVAGTAAEIGSYDITLTNSPGTANPDPILNTLTLELAQ